MNMILHGVAPNNQSLNNGDTLEDDWPTEEPTDFDAVVMNPPYSAKWSAAEGFLDDPRFSSFGVIPTASRADYTFLLHGFYHLKSEGTMAIVLPHGVLFRGSREEQIRKILLENGNIDTVIGLPEKIFFNTGIPTTVIILKKNRTNRDVLFIDASREFEKKSNQNALTEENILKILNAYKNRKNIDKYAYLASFEEIEENEFNLNIPRYVDTFEPEPVVPLSEISKNLSQTRKELESSEKELLEMLKQLHGTNPQADKELKDFIKALESFGE